MRFRPILVPKESEKFVSGGFEGSSSTHVLSVGGSYAFFPVFAVGARFDASFPEANLTIPPASSSLGASGVAKQAKSGTGFAER